MEIQERFGAIDIYLFDQLMRGRIGRGDRILDAGCGGGRNLVYFLREGFDVWGVDGNAAAVAEVREMAAAFGVKDVEERFRVETLEGMSFAEGFATVVVVSAVLHFARDETHFRAMVAGVWRVLAPGGLMFVRLASTIGIEGLVRRVEGRRYWLPDGSERFLVDEGMLMALTAELGGELADPLKTSVVQGLRSMTTWVVRK